MRKGGDIFVVPFGDWWVKVLVGCQEVLDLQHRGKTWLGQGVGELMASVEANTCKSRSDFKADA